MIVTLTGASGVGKSSIVKKLLEKISGSGLIISNTSRKHRDNDLPGEYRYLIKKEMEEMNCQNKLLWLVDNHGDYYGTATSDVVEIADFPDKIFFMILSAGVLDILKSFAKDLGIKVVSIYVLAPPEEILRERLRKRGDSEIGINKKIEDCRDWDSGAMANRHLYDYFIKNDGELKDTINEALICIKSGGKIFF